jgi:outer membrane protein insertion porin family
MNHRFYVVVCILCATFIVRAKVLDTLVIEGLTINQPSLVRNTISLWENADFTSTDIQNAIRALYKTGLFKSVDFYVTKETDSAASLLLKVTENPNIEAIEFSGNKKIPKKDFEDKMTLKKGTPLSDAAVFSAVTSMKKLYSQKGYLLADVTPQIVPTRIPGNVIVKLKCNEGPKVSVKKIMFVGNKDLKEGKLKATFKTKEKMFFWGGDFDADVYKTNLDSLILFYNDLGYINASVVKDSIWYAENKKDIYLQITISEGKKYVAGDFFFSGNKVIETSELNSVVLMKKGKPFVKSKFEATKEYVVNSFREEGFLWVQVKDRQTFRGDTVDVTFEINEGKPAIVRKIDIVGNLKTKERVVRREMKIFPGEKYKQSLMMRSVRDIYQLNFFANVKPDLKPNDDGTVDLEFTIAEKENIGQLSVGASYSAIDGVMGTFTTSIPNFRGEGQQLDLNFQYGLKRADVSIGFTEPWAFNTPTALSGSIFYSDYSYYYNYRNYGFRGSVGRRLKWPDDFFRATVGYELSWKQDLYTTANSATAANGIKLQAQGVYSGINLALERSDVDMPMFPSQGTLFSIAPDIVGLGGQFSFLKTELNYNTYFPLPYKFTLAAKSKFITMNALPTESSGELRISRFDALTLGGSWPNYGNIPLRGYPDRSIGGITGHESDGKALLLLSSELSYPLMDQTLYISLFGEMGNAWSQISDVSLTDMYPSAGVSASVNVPMLGLLGIDVGYGFRAIPSQQTAGNYFGKDTRSMTEKWVFGFRMGRAY